jgi:hypothetical protein
MFVLHTRPSNDLKEGGMDIKCSLVSQLSFELFAYRMQTDVVRS